MPPLRLAVLLAMPVCLPAVAAPPIDHYVSPAQLFPGEGIPRAPYAPLPAYDGPNGKRIGEVSAQLNPCAPAKTPQECDVPPVWHLDLDGGRQLELPHEMVGYEQEAFVAYQAARIEGGMAWSRITYDGGAFWLRTRAAELIDREGRSTGIGDFDTWCGRPGQCAPVTPAMRAEIDKLMNGSYTIIGVGPQTYHIEGIVRRGGKHYYRVRLMETEAGTPAPRLPPSGYIPTRRRDGTHTGQFSPKGC